MSTTARVLGLLPVAFLFGACSTTESISVRVMLPAPVDLGQYRVIAVESFSGNGGHDLANDLTVALKNTVNPLSGQVGFEVLDRRDVDRMLEDLRRHSGTEWDQKSMAILDRWRKAEILLKGEVQKYVVKEQILESEWLDPYGYLHINYTRECAANVTVVIEATDTDGDKIFDTIQYREMVVGRTRATDQEPDPIDHETLLTAARRNVVERYLERVMPHEAIVQVHLFTDGDFPFLSMGNGFAKTGDWDEALESYRGALEQMTLAMHENRYKALFNLGVALEYTNQFSEAREALKESYALEQDSMILGELQNVGYRERDYARLVEQGQHANPSR
jgi:tetratricopeptide (TPR) repeat protein